MAASKTVSVEAIRWALDAGVTDFGENYVKELRDKHAAVPDARWHFIGTLQSDTAHHVAALADVVETLAGERARTGSRVERRRRSDDRRPDRGRSHGRTDGRGS